MNTSSHSQTPINQGSACVVRLPDADHEALCAAVDALESTGFGVRMSRLVGIPIEKALTTLPENWSSFVTRATRSALNKAIDGALMTLRPGQRSAPANTTHRMLAGLSGAIGGSFGVAALAVELPVSTTIMLRSIADIARSEGEDISELETRIACLEVFALSTEPDSREGTDTAYYAVRSFLTKAMSDTGRHLASKGLAKEGAPVLVKFVNIVAARFSIPVSEKFAAQSVPAVGAIGGASINLAFISHFQEIARAHFTVRRLERCHGDDKVRAAYSAIAARRKTGSRPKS